MERCRCLTVDGKDVICTVVNPPVILWDIIGYSGFTCSICKQKINELNEKQDYVRKINNK